MGIWELYFITKLFLYFGKYMDFHAVPNLVLATFLILPITGPRFRNPALLRKIRQAIAIPCGIALFYHDTWLPSLNTAFSKAGQVEGFSFTYLVELLGRFFNPWVFGSLLLIFVLYYFAAKRLRITAFIFIAMLAPLFSIGQGTPEQGTGTGLNPALPASGPADEATLNSQLNAFYESEKNHTVSFPKPSPQDTAFDVIFLHICSLSWDDLEFTHQRDNPLFKRFDIVFTHFGSAASYSGPAAIRLLRGSCGQPRHKMLYDPAPAQCQTFGNLRLAGFEEQFAMNHDGHYGGFIDDVRKGGGLNAPLFEPHKLPPYLQSFDGSPVHNDLSVLSEWWATRVKSSTPRVALFYNTISLHDGNYYPGRRTNSMEIYPQRLEQLLKDMDRFFSVLQASGRKAVVVLVAEHGASIRGDKMQIAGLREIPTSLITTVPVGIKLIGLPDNPTAQPMLIDKPTSYLAISQLLANFLTVSPFGKTSLSLSDYTRDLPATNFVSENEDTVIMQRGNKYYLKTKGTEWIEYAP